MKENILVSLFVLLSFGLFAQNNTSQTKFTLKGKIAAKNTKVVYLQYFDNTDKNVKDSCIVKNGAFTFSGQVKELTPAKLKGTTKSDSEKKHNTIDFYIEPTIMQIELTENQFDKARITGSKTQIENEQYEKLKIPVLQTIDSLNNLSASISSELSEAKNRKDSTILETDHNRIFSLYIHYLGSINKIRYKFIYSHPNSYLSAFYLKNSYSYISLDSINILVDRLSPRVKNSREGKFICNIIRLKNKTSIGKMAPDFSSFDCNGNPLKLSSFKGKNYVLLDFWASWCSPCRSQYPHLKMLYQKYHPKGFEVIGIAARDTKSNWLKGIKDNGIEIWKHIPYIKDLDPKNLNIPSKENLSLKYEVSFIPIQILIDKNGMIVGRWDGAIPQNEKELDKKLEKLMGL